MYTLGALYCMSIILNETVNQKTSPATPLSTCLPSNSKMLQGPFRAGMATQPGHAWRTPSSSLSKLYSWVMSSLCLYHLKSISELQFHIMSLPLATGRMSSIFKVTLIKVPHGALCPPWVGPGTGEKQQKSFLPGTPARADCLKGFKQKTCIDIQCSGALEFLLDSWFLVISTHSTPRPSALKRLSIFSFHELCGKIHKVIHF